MHVDFSGSLDSLTDVLCQMNTRVRCIPRRQAHMVGLAPSPSPSLEASPDDEDGVESSSDDEMTTSQWLALCHSWQKGGVVLGLRVVLYLGGELV